MLYKLTATLAVLIGLPLIVLAAFNDVTFSATSEVQLTVGSDTLTFTVDGTNAESITVNTGSFSIDIASGGKTVVNVISSDKREFGVSSTPDVKASLACNANDSTLTLIRSVENPAITVTITPLSTACSSGGGGGGGGGAPVPPSSSTGTGGIDKNLGGKVEKTLLLGSLASLIFPAGVADANFQAQINPLEKSASDLSAIPKELELVGDAAMEIKLVSGLNSLVLTKDAVLSLQYENKQLQGFSWDQNSLKIYRFNSVNKLWEALPSSELSNYSQNLIITKGNIKESGIYAFLGSKKTAEQLSLEAVKPVVAPPVAVSAAFNRTLRRGMIHGDVKRLQQLLNSDPNTMVAAVGPGSLGQETDFFGSLTEKAVQKFQSKHNIVSSGSPEATGYGLAGPKTRAKLEEMFSGGETPTSVAPPAADEEAQKQELQKQINELQKMIDSLLQQLKQVQS